MSTRRTRPTTPPVSALFLDIGGILLTNGWDTDDRAAAVKTFGLDAEETERRHQLNFETHELGKLSLDEYQRRVIFYEPRAFSRADFTAFMQSRSKPYPEMIAYVRELKARHRL
jgi:putative hydrolase of the HAD superfamily